MKSKSLKAYVLFWIIMLAAGMSVLLTYQATQYFLEGFEKVSQWQMIQAADLLPEDTPAQMVAFDYHVAASWDQVPENIRDAFPEPPEQHNQLQLHLVNWWYFAPPEYSYSLLSAVNKAGEMRYISRFMDRNQKEYSGPKGIDPMVVIALWGVGSLAVFIAVAFKVLSNLTQPVRALHHWAQGIDLDKSDKPCPDFHYKELNQLAGIIWESLQKTRQTLTREKQFLGFASHELRTPIATLRSNATLLDKISPNPSAKEREVRDRILRSSLTMKGMTETLLWLNRECSEDIPLSSVNIEEAIQQVINEQEYLLTGKQINLSIETVSCSGLLPAAAFHILLTNIIRNAFQHTVQGQITLRQDADHIEVTNSLFNGDSPNQTGFGLGLILIRKLAEHLNWQIKEQKTETEMSFTVCFANRPK